MWLRSTRTTATEVAKHKKEGKLGCYAQEQRHMMLLSTIMIANDVVKDKNNYE